MLTYLQQQQSQDQLQEGEAPANTLQFVPLVGHKVRPPDADWGQLGGRDRAQLLCILIGGCQHTFRLLPVNEEYVDGALRPHQVAGMHSLGRGTSHTGLGIYSALSSLVAITLMVEVMSRDGRGWKWTSHPAEQRHR